MNELNNARKCPVCGSESAKIIMSFTPASIASMNPTYTLEKFEYAVNSKEHLLNYSQCNICEMIYCETNWDNDTLKKVYTDTIDHVKSKEKILLISKRLELLREWTGILRVLTFEGFSKLDDIKIIDYGCGWGDFLDVMGGYNIKTLGFDEDETKISFAKSRGHNIARNIDELVKFGPVDIFVMNSVLEHVLDVESIFKLVKRVLKPGGILVFLVMDYRRGYIKKNIARLKRSLPALSKDFNPVEHVNLYSYESSMNTLEHFGFKFLTTGVSLTLTNYPFLRKSYAFLTLVNKIESIFSKIILSRELGITVYSKKKETH